LVSLLRKWAASLSNIERDTTSALSIRHPEVRVSEANEPRRATVRDFGAASFEARP